MHNFYGKRLKFCDKMMGKWNLIQEFFWEKEFWVQVKHINTVFTDSLKF